MRLDIIQVLRGVAAYLVLFYHIRSMEVAQAKALQSGDLPLFDGVFRNGYAGVDLFFVISGFIMVYVTFHQPPSLTSLKDFVIARVSRIYPVWWLFATLIAIYFFVAHGAPWDAGALAEKGNSGFNHLVRSYLLLPQANFPVLGPGWTLVHEMYFYVAFAVILMLPRALMLPSLILWGAAVLIGALNGLSAIFAEDFIDLFFYPMTLEFIAGAFVGWLFMKGYVYRPGLFLILGAIGFIISLTIVDPKSGAFLFFGRVVFFTLPCAMMVYGAAGLTSQLPSGLRWLTRLGDWSFSLYLCHMLVIAGWRVVMPKVADALQGSEVVPDLLVAAFDFGAPGVLDNIVFTLLCVSAATALAAITFYGFERPLLKKVKAFRTRKTDLEKAW